MRDVLTIEELDEMMPVEPLDETLQLSEERAGAVARIFDEIDAQTVRRLVMAGG